MQCCISEILLGAFKLLDMGVVLSGYKGSMQNAQYNISWYETLNALTRHLPCFSQGKYIRRLKAIRATLESSPFFASHEVSFELLKTAVCRNVLQTVSYCYRCN